MKKYALSLLTALIATSAVSYAEEEKQPTVQVTEQMAQFADAYESALKEKLGMSDLTVNYTQGPKGFGTVVKIDHDITLRYSRVVLIEAVETLQQVVQSNPQYQSQFPADPSDYHNIDLVIDTYDSSRTAKANYGVSSVILLNGNVAYMGISHHTGKEMLLHRQPYASAVRVAHDQRLR